MTVYLVYYDTARVGRRWLGKTPRGWAWVDREAATRFTSRPQAETALRSARRRGTGIQATDEQETTR